MLLKFFRELEDLVYEENEYLTAHDEIDAEFIRDLTKKKQIVQEKIEKHQIFMNDTGKVLDEESKETVKLIIENIIDTETNNRELYKVKMNLIRKTLGSLHKERQVKTSYIKSGMKMSNFDTKK